MVFKLKMVKKVLRQALKKDQYQRIMRQGVINHKLACSGSMGSSSKIWSSCFRAHQRDLENENQNLSSKQTQRR